MPAEVKQYKDQLSGRTMLVKTAKVVPLEAIVRGYITGILAVNVSPVLMLTFL
jgi:phosphoribosylaminoimidazole-succinocarboxamide synthase